METEPTNIVGNILCYAGKQRREVSNPHITASETIELANYIVAQSAEIERLKALHNPEIVPAAAHMILTQRDEIERLKWLLREAADDIEHWSGYVPKYFVEKYKADDDIKKYREAGEVTK
jgi:uncharacterized small protein (DUF1192 family)